MDKNFWLIDFTNTSYSISSTSNKFTVIGCEALAYIIDDANENKAQYMSGCVAMCLGGDGATLTKGSCNGIGCCQTAIPVGLEYYHVRFDDNFNTSDIHEFSPCNFAVLMESSNFTFLTSYPSSLDFNKTYEGRAPLVVDWAVAGTAKTCNDARKDPSTYACIGSHSDCFNSPSGKGYICNCSKGFEGNPYLRDSVFGCKGICVSVLTCLILFLGKEWIKQKQRIARQEHMRKINECFEHNGGQLLIDMMKVECNISFKLYGREEIEMATNNFDASAIIGQGGQGTVNIGHNLDPDNNPVAIKRCKGFDENRRMDFGKELLILSRVNHQNIVKLIGCSLQFDVPVLVYEYVPNKTMHYLIPSHDSKAIRTLDIRLKIATKSAEALAYLHTLNHPILHGDVKSANILLGPDLSAKVADFGCSMIISAAENIQAVKGTIGYLDPEYLLKLELTDKSDVYSFGVILLELLTRKHVVSKERGCLASVFQEALKKGKHDELLDSEIILDDQDNMDVVHQLAELAARCLVMPAEHRPTMSEVAKELRLLEGVVQQRSGVQVHSERLLLVPDISSTSTSEFYSGRETTNYDSIKKKAWMSIEFAR